MTSKIFARSAVLAVLVFAVAACSSLGPGPSSQLYVLNPQLGPIGDAPQTKWQLVVAPPESAESFDTNRIALSQNPVTMDYYANAVWPDRAPVLIQGLLVEALDKSGKITAAARDTEGLRGDYLLETEVKDFTAHYSVPDGVPTVTVRIVAKLVSTTDRQIVASLDSIYSAPADMNTVPAVVMAFNAALGASLEEITGWALHALPADEVAPVPATPAPAPEEQHHRHHHG